MESRRSPPLATRAITSVAEGVVRALRRLGDAEGGHAGALTFLRRHLDVVVEYLRRGRFASADVRPRLMAVYAQLNQVAGCLSADAERYVAANRYYRLALGTANELADESLSAYVMSCMAHHAAYRGRRAEAAELITAAVGRAASAHPRVRTAVAARVSHERAAAGDLSGFRAAAERVDRMASDAFDAGPGPDYAYWCQTERLRASRGFDVVSLLVSARYPRLRWSRRLLTEAQGLLAGEIGPAVPERARDGALFTGWLARSQLFMGEAEQAVSTAESAVEWLEQVRSRRVRRVLREFGRDAAAEPGLRSLAVAERFQERLRTAVGA